MVLTRFGCIFAVCCLMTSLATIRVSAADLPDCRDSADLLQSLQRELADTRERQATFDAIYADQFSSDLSFDDALPEAIPETAVEEDLKKWPADIDCPSLQKQYLAARHDLIKGGERLIRHQKGWATQPEALSDALTRVWNSRQRLMKQYEALGLAAEPAEDRGQDGGTGSDSNNDNSEALIDPDTATPDTQTVSDVQAVSDVQTVSGVQAVSDVQTASGSVQTRLSDLRRDFFKVLHAIHKDVSPETIADLLTLWRHSYDIDPSAAVPSEAVFEALPDSERGLSRDYFRLAQLDVMVQRNALNDVRAWLWEFHKAKFKQVGQAELKGLLADEDKAFRNRLDWLASDFQYGSTEANGSRVQGWVKGFEYLLGFLTFPLLAMLARKLSSPAGRLQGRFAHWSRKRRLTSQVSRATAGLPLLLPWLVGLLGLHLLQLIFTHYHLPLLNSLLPLARLFILYGLICLAGEWLLLRIAQQAGSFLNEEQLALVHRHARASAAVAVLPLFIEDLVRLGVGPSRLLDICSAFSLVGFLLAIGLLLRSRRQDFIDALKSVLPSNCDGLIEKLLGERLFLLVAPIAAPPLLLALLGSFMHKALFDYDWYRKVFARSFKLRAAAAEASQPEVVLDSKAMEEYQRWFLDESTEAGAIPTEVGAIPNEASAIEVPFIDSGLYGSVRKSLDQWIADKSCENSLLLTGARGSGKTSVLHRLQQGLTAEHPDITVRAIDVPAKTITAEETLDLLGEALEADLTTGPSALVRTDSERQPTLIILDNAQNLFLRRVGGLRGWETLLSMTNARVENVFWLIVINNQSWAYLSNIYGEDYQFRNIKVAKRWSQNEVRSLILSRNHLSGCKIRYDDILLSTRGPEAGSIRNAEQLYFSLLWDACLGNPMLALRLWLSSVHIKGNTAVVGLPDEVSGAWLEQLSNDLHFVYAAIMIHENMTSDELVETTALPERVVRTALKTAFDAGFIQRSEKRRYRIVPLWYPTIMKLLSRKNLLHE